VLGNVQIPLLFKMSLTALKHIELGTLSIEKNPFPAKNQTPVPGSFLPGFENSSLSEPLRCRLRITGLEAVRVRNIFRSETKLDFRRKVLRDS